MPAMVQEKYANLQSGGEALPSCERVPDSMVLEKRVERPPGAASRRANLNNSSDSLSAARQLYGDGDACPARRRRPRQDALGRSLAFPTKTTKGQRRSRWPATTVVNHLPPVKSAIKNPERCPVPVSGRGQRPRDSECPPRKRRKMQRGSEPNPTVAGSSLSGVQFRPSSLVDGGSATSSATHVVNTDLSDFESVAGSFESNDRSDVPKDDPPQAAPGSLRQSECRAPFDCTDACRSKCRGRHKNRRRRIIQGDARKSDDSHHAISRHMASSNLTRSVSKRKQRSRLRQLPPVEQSRISQVLEVFASLVDGKSRDVFSLVSLLSKRLLGDALTPHNTKHHHIPHNRLIHAHHQARQKMPSCLVGGKLCTRARSLSTGAYSAVVDYSHIDNTGLHMLSVWAPRVANQNRMRSWHAVLPHHVQQCV